MYKSSDYIIFESLNTVVSHCRIQLMSPVSTMDQYWKVQCNLHLKTKQSLFFISQYWFSKTEKYANKFKYEIIYYRPTKSTEHVFMYVYIGYLGEFKKKYLLLMIWNTYQYVP